MPRSGQRDKLKVHAPREYPLLLYKGVFDFDSHIWENSKKNQDAFCYGLFNAKKGVKYPNFPPCDNLNQKLRALKVSNCFFFKFESVRIISKYF